MTAPQEAIALLADLRAKGDNPVALVPELATLHPIARLLALYAIGAQAPSQPIADFVADTLIALVPAEGEPLSKRWTGAFVQAAFEGLAQHGDPKKVAQAMVALAPSEVITEVVRAHLGRMAVDLPAEVFDHQRADMGNTDLLPSTALFCLVTSDQEALAWALRAPHQHITLRAAMQGIPDMGRLTADMPAFKELIETLTTRPEVVRLVFRCLRVIVDEAGRTDPAAWVPAAEQMVAAMERQGEGRALAGRIELAALRAMAGQPVERDMIKQPMADFAGDSEDYSEACISLHRHARSLNTVDWFALLVYARGERASTHRNVPYERVALREMFPLGQPLGATLVASGRMDEARAKIREEEGWWALNLGPTPALADPALAAMADALVDIPPREGNLMIRDMWLAHLVDFLVEGSASAATVARGAEVLGLSRKRSQYIEHLLALTSCDEADRDALVASALHIANGGKVQRPQPSAQGAN